jgi:hypothetical protein
MNPSQSWSEQNVLAALTEKLDRPIGVKLSPGQIHFRPVTPKIAGTFSASSDSQTASQVTRNTLHLGFENDEIANQQVGDFRSSYHLLVM